MGVSNSGIESLSASRAMDMRRIANKENTTILNT